MSRTINIKLKVYTVDEACEVLARLVKHKRRSYSRGGFYRIVRLYNPELTKTEFTEVDLRVLAECIRKPGRPKRNVDKNE